MILRNAFFRDLPQERRLYDYGARTDGNPVYRGNAKLGTPTSAASWIMVYTKYNDNGDVIEEYCLEGVWDNRAVLFLEYV